MELNDEEVEFHTTGDVITPILQQAVGVYDVETCRELLISGADIDAQCEEFGATLMHYAALNVTHGLEMIDFLCSSGLRVDAKDNFGNTPIHYAVDAENFEIARDLMERYIESRNVPICNLLHFFVQGNNLKLAKSALENDPQMLFDGTERGHYAFHIAAECADVKMCKMLLSKGADPRVVTNNRWETTALHVVGGNKTHGKELVRFFVSRLNFDVNEKDKLDYTPLHYALDQENFDVVNELLSLGADLTEKRECFYMENLMHSCVQENNFQCAKFLHERNKNLIKEFRKDGKNCIHIAATYADLVVCKWLVSEGLDPRAVTTNVSEGTALHFAAVNKLYCKELVRFFVSSLKFDVNEKDKLDFTPLHYAMHNENLEAANELLSLGADLTVKRTAYLMENLMHYCLQQNSLKTAKFLHERNKNLIKEFSKDGKSCLHHAALGADLEMCNWLLNEGVNPQEVSKDDHEDNALHFAGRNKAHGKELVRFFVSSLKFNVNEKDKFDLTPLHYALQNENLDAAQELLSLGADLTVKRKVLLMENLMHHCVRLNKINSAKFVHERNKDLVMEVRLDGVSCLLLAAYCADQEMCKWLLSEGLDPRVVANNSETTALHIAGLNKAHGKELVRFFVSSLKFDVNAKEKNGFSPLHYALENESLDAAQELLSLGADLTVKRSSGTTENLMHYCVRRNKINSAKFVHERNQDLVKELRKDGLSCLHVAAYCADQEMCKWLIDECGVDPRAQCTNNGKAAVHFAAFNKKHAKDVTSFFVSKFGLEVNAMDEFGCT